MKHKAVGDAGKVEVEMWDAEGRPLCRPLKFRDGRSRPSSG